jgi:hypothetical protein
MPKMEVYIDRFDDEAGEHVTEFAGVVIMREIPRIGESLRLGMLTDDGVITNSTFDVVDVNYETALYRRGEPERAGEARISLLVEYASTDEDGEDDECGACHCGPATSCTKVGGSC